MALRISRATRAGRRLGHAGEPAPRLAEEAQRAGGRADQPGEHAIERVAQLALDLPPDAERQALVPAHPAQARERGYRGPRDGQGLLARPARAAHEAARLRVQRRAGKGKRTAAFEAAIQPRTMAEEIERPRREAEGHPLGSRRPLQAPQAPD